MGHVEYALVAANLIAGFGFAFPMVKVLAKVGGKQVKAFRYYIKLIGVYLLECVVLMIGMGIPVLNVVLAFVWGLVFGRWLRNRTSRDAALRASFRFSLYSSLPAMSFVLVPVLAGLEGWNVLSAADGVRFGIPDFLHLPWPVSTILGFYVAIILVGVVLKTGITVGEVSLLMHPREESTMHRY